MVQTEASADHLEPVSKEQTATLDAGEEDNVGDSEIVKSPSDPKQYR